MRYAEKSFEVRFCAALTAAIMPGNRNPQWFGLTQAEERKYGIDTALGIGGRLILFQFKAKQKQDKKIKIEYDQWQKLRKIEARYSNSTFYVFPEAGDIFTAERGSCLFSHAWCCPPLCFSSSFQSGKKSASFSLNPDSSQLERHRPQESIAVKPTCKKFGCFCPPSAYDIIAIESIASGYRTLFRLSTIGDGQGIVSDVALPPFGQSDMGIPLSREPNKSDDGIEPITSSEQFERLFGDGARKNWDRGIYGLFIPT